MAFGNITAISVPYGEGTDIAVMQHKMGTCGPTALNWLLRGTCRPLGAYAHNWR